MKIITSAISTKSPLNISVNSKGNSNLIVNLKILNGDKLIIGKENIINIGSYVCKISIGACERDKLKHYDFTVLINDEVAAQSSGYIPDTEDCDGDIEIFDLNVF